MKKQVLFIHSAGPQEPGRGSSNLVHFLVKELGDDFDLIYPEMPDPENPIYDEWKDKLTLEFSRLKKDAVLVGHSIGGSALLKFLSEEPADGSFSGLFLVATPVWDFDKDWIKEDFTLSKEFADKLSNISRIVLFHSIGDSVVPYAHAEKYAELLSQAEIKNVSGDSHLFETGLAELIEEIKRL